MDANLIARCTGARYDRACVHAEALTTAMTIYAINTRARQAMFLANVGHESMRLARLVESLDYSVEALLLKFGRHRISEADARRFGRTPTRPADQVAIGNAIYGGEWGRVNLGNTKPGDGFKFKAHGHIGTTGRANHAAARDRLRARVPTWGVPDFEEFPERLSLPDWGALAAADFWDMHGLNAYADRGDFDGVADVINKGRKTAPIGDANGYQDRLEIYRGAVAALGGVR